MCARGDTEAGTEAAAAVLAICSRVPPIFPAAARLGLHVLAPWELWPGPGTKAVTPVSPTTNQRRSIDLLRATNYYPSLSHNEA